VVAGCAYRKEDIDQLMQQSWTIVEEDFPISDYDSSNDSE